MIIGWFRGIELPRQFLWEVWNAVPSILSTMFTNSDLSDSWEDVNKFQQNKLLPRTESNANKTQQIVEKIIIYDPLIKSNSEPQINSKSNDNSNSSLHSKVATNGSKFKNSLQFPITYNISNNNYSVDLSELEMSAKDSIKDGNISHSIKENKTNYINVSERMFTTRKTTLWHETISGKSDIFNVYTKVIPLISSKKRTIPPHSFSTGMIGSKQQRVFGSQNPMKTQKMDSLAVREFFQSLKRKQAPTVEQQMVNSLATQEEVKPSKQTFTTYNDPITPIPISTSASIPAWYISPNPHPKASKPCSSNSNEKGDNSYNTDFVNTSPSSKKSKNVSNNVAANAQDIFRDLISTKKCKYLVKDKRRVSPYSNVKYGSFRKLPWYMQNYSFNLSPIIDTFENKMAENTKGGEALKDTLNHLLDDSIE